MTRHNLDRLIESESNRLGDFATAPCSRFENELLTFCSELVALCFQDFAARENGALRVLIRRNKADPLDAERAAFTSRKTAAMASDGIEWRGPELDRRFCPIYHGKPINRSPEPTIVKRFVKDAAKRVGFDPLEVDTFSGHLMRVGAAQNLLKRGFDTAVIMRAGGRGSRSRSSGDILNRSSIMPRRE
ncbi:tyrosine-type recombinase/integrase [Thioclava pacifica]|uniref:tyrosine-type recombinase/integrase n=1 Tax=Thioclava pacifica TaxID=285109 RepID=UPI0012F7185E|nr:tyrosine-type recombinase/integrase [Thioclava pacifica]